MEEVTRSDEGVVKSLTCLHMNDLLTESIQEKFQA